MDSTLQNSSPLTIGFILKNAWHHVKGSKAAIWLALLTGGLLIAAVTTLLTKLLGFDFKQPPFFINFFILPIINSLVMAPFYAGTMMVALKHVRGESIQLKTGYQYFSYYLPVAITLIIVSFIASAGMIVVNIPVFANKLGTSKSILDLLAGLFYLLIYTFLMLSVLFVIDKNQKPFQAIQSSCATIRPHWGKIFLAIVSAYLLFILATIPVFIGMIIQNYLVILLGAVIVLLALIWLLPLFVVMHGVIYRRLVA